MKKSKHKHKKQDHRPILIPTAALNKLLKLSAPYNTNCPVMYLFWMKECIRQKTNRIWCTDSYMAGRIGEDGERKGLKWAITRVKRTKAKLIEVGYGKIVQMRGAKGHFSKSYIEVKYYPSRMKIENEEYLRILDEDAEEFAYWINYFTAQQMRYEVKIAELEKQVTVGTNLVPPAKLTVGTNNGPTVKGTGSAYSKGKKMLIKKNLVATKDGDSEYLLVPNGANKDKRFYEKCFIFFIDALQVKRKVFKKVNKNKWMAQFEKLHKDDGVKKKVIKDVLKWYVKNMHHKYTPKAYSARTFRDKFGRIAAAKEREEKERKGNGGKIKTKKYRDIDGTETGETKVYYGK